MAAAVGLLVATGPFLVACEDPEEVLTEAAVRVALDDLGTFRIEKEGYDVDSLDCDTPDEDVPDSVSVTCTGRTEDGRGIRVEGSVSGGSGTCLRGDLTAVVGDRTVFDAGFLGDCDK